MDNMVTAVINGEERPLNYSVEIMFKVNEKFGGVKDALNAVESETREGAESVFWLLAELVNDGELCRREKGLEPMKMIRAEDFSLRMQPLEYIRLKDAVIQAIGAGYKRETDSNEEVDLGLAEIKKKKAPAGA